MNDPLRSGAIFKIRNVNIIKSPNIVLLKYNHNDEVDSKKNTPVNMNVNYSDDNLHHHSNGYG